ncbi:hypothetical protein M9Y10_018410 [Tritrichomonas musculus]|uniref:DUF3447 domain-containing protein n=1 Tax=Tritrichomonas musculus TaxID=1915356 RepID=A0ABR2HNH8_9EUKA
MENKNIDHLKKMKIIQENLLEYIDCENNLNENLEIFKQFLHDQNINDDCYELKEFFDLLVEIANNHHRTANFYTKIDSILLFLKNEINQHYSNFEIFNTFRSNKRILLFLFQEQIFKIDSEISIHILKSELKDYFYNESISIYSNDFNFQSEEEKALFDEKRKEGENDSYICQLIRKDSVVEFISYVNKIHFRLNSNIEQSIFETNQFLNENKISLIDYAAFFGSICIFKYLFINKVRINPDLKFCAIHGRNPEIIHFLEENKIIQNEISLIFESIKCHHNELANYFLSNLQNNEISKILDENHKQIFKSFNYTYLENVLTNPYCDFYLFKYEYIKFVEILLNRPDFDVNADIV